jgi:hypothetical protein
MKKLSLLILFVCLATVGAQERQIVAVDTEDVVGSWTSLALDDLGYPHIAYQKTNPDCELRYAYWDGAQWVIEVIDDEGFPGKYTSLALDSQGRPHISYFAEDPVDMRYAHWDGAEWIIETLEADNSAGSYSDLALDSNDYPHLIYYDVGLGAVKYAYWDGVDWTIETVLDGGFIGVDGCIALDSNDLPHLIFQRYGMGTGYYHWDGAAWQSATPAIGTMLTNYDLAVDSNDHPHFVYNDGDENALCYAYYDGAAWQTEQVTTELQMGLYSSLVLDENDYPHVAHYDNENDDLVYTWWDGAAWTSEILDEEDVVGRYPSLVLDENDNPVISYFDAGGLDLNFLWTNSPPPPFSLLDPEDGSIFETWPEVSWEEVVDFPAVGYALLYSTDPDFATYDEITGLDTTSYTFTGDELVIGPLYYWKVRATDGFAETISNETWSFQVSPTFHLLSPPDGQQVPNWPRVDWEDLPLAVSPTYDLWFSTEPDFAPHQTITGLTNSEYQFGPLELRRGMTYYWKVQAWQSSSSFWSAETWSFTVPPDLSTLEAELTSTLDDDGVLLSWTVEGGSPAAVRLLRDDGSGEPVYVGPSLDGRVTRYLDRRADAGHSYSYWLELTMPNGNTRRFGPTEELLVPEPELVFSLEEPWPCPAIESVSLAFTLPEARHVSLAVYDLSGRRVAQLTRGELGPGRHQLAWDCSGESAGLYLLRLESENRTLSRRVVVGR